MGQPRNPSNPKTLVWTTITLGLSQETHDWYKSLSSRGDKAKMLREAIALYRSQNTN